MANHAESEFRIRAPQKVRHASEIGAIAKAQRRRQGLTQLDLAGIGNTGNRFVVDVEAGKPTVQLQKVLDLLDLLGIDVLLKPRG